jgi:hypothetical protein
MESLFIADLDFCPYFFTRFLYSPVSDSSSDM